MLQPTVSQYLTAQKHNRRAKTLCRLPTVRPGRDRNQRLPKHPAPRTVRSPANLQCAKFCRGQSGLKDPFAYETPAFDLTGYGLPDDMIAALWIPRLDLDLPVYPAPAPQHGPRRCAAGADLDAAGRREHQLP